MELAATTAELEHTRLRVALGSGGVKRNKIPPPWTAKRPRYVDPTTPIVVTPKVQAAKRKPARRKATPTELIAMLDAAHRKVR